MRGVGIRASGGKDVKTDKTLIPRHPTFKGREHHFSVLFDFDNTLFLTRTPAWLTDDCDYAQFCNRCLGAPAIAATANAARQCFSQGFNVVVLTVRNEAFRSHCEQMLVRANIPVTDILMRAAGDTRPDEVVKAELLANAERLYGPAILAYDDDPVQVAMYGRCAVDAVLVDAFSEELEQ